MATSRSLLRAARVARGLTQEAVARLSGTSQPTLSAYERGTKAPTLPVVERILHSLGYELDLQPLVTFRDVEVQGGDFSFVVPNRLWRVDPPACFAPLRLTSPYGGQKIFDLTDPQARAVAYAWLIRTGSPMALREYVDGALLADAWPQVARHLSEQMRREWGPVVLEAREGWLIERLLSGRSRR